MIAMWDKFGVGEGCGQLHHPTNRPTSNENL